MIYPHLQLTYFFCRSCLHTSTTSPRGNDLSVLHLNQFYQSGLNPFWHLFSPKDVGRWKHPLMIMHFEDDSSDSWVVDRWSQRLPGWIWRCLTTHGLLINYGCCWLSDILEPRVFVAPETVSYHHLQVLSPCLSRNLLWFFAQPLICCYTYDMAGHCCQCSYHLRCLSCQG